jgi:hypothetical protein
VKFIGFDELHAAFLIEAAHLAVDWACVQEIRVWPWKEPAVRLAIGGSARNE